MLQLTTRQPSEIHADDHINHAGATAKVIKVEHTDNAWDDVYTLFIRYEYTGGLYIVHYHANETITRYE